VTDERGLADVVIQIRKESSENHDEAGYLSKGSQQTQVKDDQQKATEVND